MTEGPRIYNLFPLLAGPLPAWPPHIARACRMGFNWIFVNPIQQPGASGSLYSIYDYYAVNPLLAEPDAGAPEEQLRRVIEEVHSRGMKIMIDLVINHTAADSRLIAAHPAWFRRDDSGAIIHPGAWANGEWVSWKDLAAVDNASSPDRETLWQYWLNFVRHCAALGFDGFRCDAAYQVPTDLWRFLIGSSRKEYPALQFFAETLGCTPAQTIEVARAGFDFIFNSSQWWDFTAPWCLDQLRETAPVVPSISFPESHDTVRLVAELDGNRDAVRQRTVFAALFTTGWMIPMGFEFGFRRRLHVVNTRPRDWEEPRWDDTEFIRRLNALKSSQRIWNEDAAVASLDTGNPNVVALDKTSRDGALRALLLLNKDRDLEQSCDRELSRQLPRGNVLEISPTLASHAAGLSAPITLPPVGFKILVTNR